MTRQLGGGGTSRLFVITALVLAGAAWPAGSAQADGGIAAYQGEELFYSLEFLGSSMARAAMVVGEAQEHELGRLIPVEGLALTAGMAALIYPMRDTGETWIDPATGLARTSLKVLDERGQRRTYQVDFGQDTYSAQVTRERDGGTNYYERLVPSSTHDALSWIYAVRGQDLTVGATQIYYVFDGWKLSRLTVVVVDDDEDILVGDEFIRCARLTLYREVLSSVRPLPMIQETATLPPTMWVRETASGEQMGELWISNDRRRLPAQVTFENALISVVGRLERYRPPADGY